MNKSYSHYDDDPNAPPLGPWRWTYAGEILTSGGRVLAHVHRDPAVPGLDLRQIQHSRCIAHVPELFAFVHTRALAGDPEAGQLMSGIYASVPAA
jgi:hypothetical protein